MKPFTLEWWMNIWHHVIAERSFCNIHEDLQDEYEYLCELDVWIANRLLNKYGE